MCAYVLKAEPGHYVLTGSDVDLIAPNVAEAVQLGSIILIDALLKTIKKLTGWD